MHRKKVILGVFVAALQIALVTLLANLGTAQYLGEGWLGIIILSPIFIPASLFIGLLASRYKAIPGRRSEGRFRQPIVAVLITAGAYLLSILLYAQASFILR